MIIHPVEDPDFRILVDCPGKGKKRTRGSELPKVSQKTLAVSSTVLRMASPVWRAMFDHQEPSNSVSAVVPQRRGLFH